MADTEADVGEWEWEAHVPAPIKPSTVSLVSSRAPSWHIFCFLYEISVCLVLNPLPLRQRQQDRNNTGFRHQHSPAFLHSHFTFHQVTSSLSFSFSAYSIHHHDNWRPPSFCLLSEKKKTHVFFATFPIIFQPSYAAYHLFVLLSVPIPNIPAIQKTDNFPLYFLLPRQRKLQMLPPSVNPFQDCSPFFNFLGPPGVLPIPNTSTAQTGSFLYYAFFTILQLSVLYFTLPLVS